LLKGTPRAVPDNRGGYCARRKTPPTDKAYSKVFCLQRREVMHNCIGSLLEGIRRSRKSAGREGAGEGAAPWARSCCCHLHGCVRDEEEPPWMCSRRRDHRSVPTSPRGRGGREGDPPRCNFPHARNSDLPPLAISTHRSRCGRPRGGRGRVLPPPPPAQSARPSRRSSPLLWWPGGE
jgi:hypothetical protein